MRKQLSATFKAQVVHALRREEQSVAQLAAEYGVHPTQLGTWNATALHGLPSLVEERAAVGTLKAAHQAQRTALDAAIGRLTTQVAWLKKTPWPANWIGPSVSRSWSAINRHGHARSGRTSSAFVVRVCPTGLVLRRSKPWRSSTGSTRLPHNTPATAPGGSRRRCAATA